jgi:hypothetical protein
VLLNLLAKLSVPPWNPFLLAVSVHRPLAKCATCSLMHTFRLVTFLLLLFKKLLQVLLSQPVQLLQDSAAKPLVWA